VILLTLEHSCISNKYDKDYKNEHRWKQGIINVREWIPHKGLIPKVIPLKLFLDMVPSSAEDVTRVDSPSDFLETTGTKWREMCWKVILLCFDFQKTFRSRDLFWTLSRLLVRPGFRLQREIVTFWIFERTWTTTANFLNFFSNSDAVLHILAVWDVSDSDGQIEYNESKFSRNS